MRALHEARLRELAVVCMNHGGSWRAVDYIHVLHAVAAEAEEGVLRINEAELQGVENGGSVCDCIRDRVEHARELREAK